MTRDYFAPDYQQALLRLFRAGAGDTPPLLAGREAPLGKLEDLFGNLTGAKHERRNPPRDAILYGPRGNGKTVMLNVLGNTCRAARADVVSLTPDQLANNTELAARLLYNDSAELGSLLARLQPDSLKLRIPLLGEAGWRDLSPVERDNYQLRHLEGLLAARCQERPLVVTLDEAHTLEFEVGRTLLNLSQNLRSGHGAPFLLVLAGTPDLEARLGRMGASFWDRAEVLDVNRLSREATAEALVKPLRDRDIAFEPEALATVVDESQQYPYFIQVWGAALCAAMVQARNFRVTTGIVGQARAEAAATCARYYGRRYREMDTHALLAAAVTLGAVYAGDEERHPSQTLRQAVLASGAAPDEDAADSLLGRLSDLGYIWRQSDSVLWEPGIPSLMTYILSQGRQASIKTS